MKIGIFGGTFNPIHVGHLELAQECWHKLTLDKVVFVPAHIPPHKDVEGDCPSSDRLNMVRLALEGDSRFEISTYEIDKKEVSYSIDTIKHFKEKYGTGTELYFLIGSDWIKELSTWKDIDKILEEVTFVAVNRPGFEGKTEYKNKVKEIFIPGIDVSSSDIRKRVKEKKPIDFLVPAKVVAYIRNKGLYR